MFNSIAFAALHATVLLTGASGALRPRLRERLVERGYLRDEAFARVSE
jgi:hypothetical protein